MIVVKVELHSAVTGQITEIGRLTIANDGTSLDKKKGNYNIKLMKRGTGDNVLKEGRVEEHPRLSQSIWKLVKKALKAVKI